MDSPVTSTTDLHANYGISVPLRFVHRAEGSSTAKARPYAYRDGDSHCGSQQICSRTRFTWQRHLWTTNSDRSAQGKSSRSEDRHVVALMAKVLFAVRLVGKLSLESRWISEDERFVARRFRKTGESMTSMSIKASPRVSGTTECNSCLSNFKIKPEGFNSG